MLTVEHDQSLTWLDTIRPVVEQATTWLRSVVEGADFPITAHWEVIRMMKSYEYLVVLRLSTPDIRTRPAGVFSVEELCDQQFATLAFRELYLALLRFKSDALFHPHGKSLAVAE